MAELQRFLEEEGAAPPGRVSGRFGPDTTAALRRWQRAAGVPASGCFGDVSRLAYLRQQVNAHCEVSIRQCLKREQTLLRLLM